MVGETLFVSATAFREGHDAMGLEVQFVPPGTTSEPRLGEDEFNDLVHYAAQRGLPVSTVVRMVVMQTIAPAEDLKAAWIGWSPASWRCEARR